MGRKSGSVPSPPPEPEWHSAPQMPVCSIAPHSFGPLPREGGWREAVWERGLDVCPAATFESLILQKESL